MKRQQCKKCGNFLEDGVCAECLAKFMNDNLTEDDIDNIAKALLGDNAWEIIRKDNLKHQEKPNQSN